MEKTGKDKTEIVYFTDPLCCWSWVFEETWKRFKHEFAGEIQWRYCMSGLIPDWKHFYDAMNSVSRPAQMGPVWMHASETSGVHINHKIWIDDPPASSFPPCVAVKTAGLQSSEAADELLSRLRKALMTDGLNISKKEILFRIAEELIEDNPLTMDYELFVSDFSSGRALGRFRDDV